MIKEFIPYKQALELKELGFDEECLTSYNYNGTLIDMWSAIGFVTNSSLIKPEQFNANSNSKLLIDYINNPFTAAPLYQQAFDFFRDKYGLWQTILQNTDVDWTYDILPIMGMHDYKLNDVFETYQEAKLACLNKLIEIVKQK